MSRIEKTIDFLNRTVGKNKKVLDLGVSNALGKAMEKNGYDVINTKGEDLDVEFEKYAKMDVEVVTAFEIFEHMLAPFNILRRIQADELVASIPLKLWFASAYWNENDVWDRHYHEFEPRQFIMLMERSGWEVIDSEKWRTPGSWFGIRPILRQFTDRYLIVYCKRIKGYRIPS